MEILRTQLMKLGFFHSHRLHMMRPGEREKQKVTKYTVIMMIICILYISPHALAYAGASEELMPGSKISSPFYQKYDVDAYMLDYVPEEDMDILDVEGRWYWSLALIINFSWVIYVFLVEFCIRMVNWVYDTTLTNEMIGLLKKVMPDLWDVVWGEFWWVTASVGILGVVLIFTLGRSLEAVQKMLAIVLIAALAPLIPTIIPGTATALNDSVTIAGGSVLNKLIKTEIDTAEVSQNTIQNTEAFQNLQRHMIVATNIEHKLEVIRGVHAVDDALWKSLVYKPWLVANFGRMKGDEDAEIESPETYARQLLLKGDNKEQRRKYLREVGEINDEGKTDKEEFKIFTADGIEDRLINAWGAMLFPGAVILVLVGFAVVILIWTARGIGRACMLVFYALFALWPGYGLGELARSIFSTVQAFLMKLFYTVALGVMLAIWNVFQDPEEFPSLHLGSRVIILLILILALWAEVKEVYQRFRNPPGINGQPMDLNRSDPNDSVGGPAGKAMKAGVNHLLMRGNMKKVGIGKKPTSVKNAVVTGQKKYQGMKQRMSRAFSPKQAQVRSNLSQGARRLYTRMQNQKKNPMQKEERQQWVAANPGDAHLIREIDQWSQQDLEQMTSGDPVENGKIPARIPAKNSPEYAVFEKDKEWQQQHKLWKQTREETHQEAWENYREKIQRYEQKGFFGSLRRIMLKEPQLVQPSDIKVMERFQEKMDSIKKGNDRAK